jgi:hypothetical protein
MASSNLDKVQTVLAQKLHGFEKSELKTFAATIAKLQANGLQIDDAFPFGILNPDSVMLSGNLNPDQLGELGALLKMAGPLKHVDVFPRGIVAPESLRVKLTIHR